MKPIILFLSLIAGSLVFSPAGAEPIPKALEQGFESYKQEGVSAAFDKWLRGSILNLSAQKKQFVKKLETVESLCGTFTGYSMLHQQPLAANSQISYVQLDYQRCPVFARYVLYKVEKNWVVVQFNLHTRPQEILPEVLLGSTSTH